MKAKRLGKTIYVTSEPVNVILSQNQGQTLRQVLDQHLADRGARGRTAVVEYQGDGEVMALRVSFSKGTMRTRIEFQFSKAAMAMNLTADELADLIAVLTPASS